MLEISLHKITQLFILWVHITGERGRARTKTVNLINSLIVLESRVWYNS